MKIPFSTALIILLAFAVSGCGQKVTGIEQSEGDRLYEVSVKQVIMDSSGGRTATPVIILANKENSKQILPIWVGMAEGISISMALEENVLERPGTHDLFANVLQDFHMKLEKVVISDLRDRTYFAIMMMKSEGEKRDIDARPSDAIALALRQNSPVFVSEMVIRKGGWMKVQEPQPDKGQQGKKRKESEEDKDLL